VGNKSTGRTAQIGKNVKSTGPQFCLGGVNAEHKNPNCTKQREGRGKHTEKKKRRRGAKVPQGEKKRGACERQMSGLVGRGTCVGKKKTWGGDIMSGRVEKKTPSELSMAKKKGPEAVRKKKKKVKESSFQQSKGGGNKESTP